MNAVEFVKKFGIFGAKEYLSGSIFYEDKLMVFTNEDDLKQIINALELVETYGGIQRSKDHLNHRREYGLYQLPNLVQAINLVEQCR